MEIIEQLSDMIEEELDDAEKYIKCAIEKKESYPETAATFAKLSAEEMGHVNALHTQVVALIDAYRKEHGSPPEKMQDRYDYIHGKHIKHANQIKILQSVYKG